MIDRLIEPWENDRKVEFLLTILKRKELPSRNGKKEIELDSRPRFLISAKHHKNILRSTQQDNCSCPTNVQSIIENMRKIEKKQD